MERIRTKIIGTNIDVVTFDQAVERVRSFLGRGRHHLVTPNAEFLLDARINEQFRHVLNRADLAVPDGFGVVIASRFTQHKINHSVPGSSLVPEILAMAKERGLRVLVLTKKGSLSRPEEIETEVGRLYPGIDIMALSVSGDQVGDNSTREKIALAEPQILFVAFGSPDQDLWISQNLDSLPSVRLAAGIGGTFDFLTGKRSRAPQFWRRLGLEWLWRLFTKPKGGKYYFGKRLKKIARSVIVFPCIFVFTLNKG